MSCPSISHKYPGLKSSLNERNEVHRICFWIISEDTIFFDEKFCEIDSFHFMRLVLSLGYFFFKFTGLGIVYNLKKIILLSTPTKNRRKIQESNYQLCT